jgi:hypothetical protein
MQIYLGASAEFAKQDVASGEDLYGNMFMFIATQGINHNFELFGSDNMVMMTNSGSFFILQILLLLNNLIFKALHVLAVRFAHYKCMRVMGTKIYKKAKFSFCLSASEKLWIESYFSIWLAICINLLGFCTYHKVFS